MPKGRQFGTDPKQGADDERGSRREHGKYEGLSDHAQDRGRPAGVITYLDARTISDTRDNIESKEPLSTSIKTKSKTEKF